jgi:hypothetical protein
MISAKHLWGRDRLASEGGGSVDINIDWHAAKPL